MDKQRSDVSLRGHRKNYAHWGVLFGLLTGCAQASPRPQSAAETADAHRHGNLESLLAYIDSAWTTLSRDLDDLPEAAVDPKFHEQTKWPIYVSRQENIASIKPRLERLLQRRGAQDVYIAVLPIDTRQVAPPGLLYLPHPYVVPGGRFNEMYGWDSYFIVTGLLQTRSRQHHALAKHMTDNALYQVQHFGKVLNANRSYFLERSQPPLLSRMVREVFDKQPDAQWLREAIPLLERFYAYWLKPPRLTPGTGLSRYYAGGQGPAPEVLADEVDAQGRSHYDRVHHEFQTSDVKGYAAGRFYNAKLNQLTPLFYVADRTMRESGFDPSNRFGAFNIGIIDYNPVCLNTLLYVMEQDIAWAYQTVGDNDAAKPWLERAERRKQQMQRVLWDEARGLFLDYNFSTQTRRDYPFLTAFWPMWAGIATKAQAERLVANLKLFQAPGGLMTSNKRTGNQWDAPYGWGNLHQLVVLGLRRYGYHRHATDIANRFIALVLKEFEEHGAIFEKYDVVARESSVAAGIRYGYSANQVGFGWTNAAVLVLEASSRGVPPLRQ